MKENYIIAGGDSDGLLGTVVALHKLKDAFFTFTSASGLSRSIDGLVRSGQGDLFIIDLPISSHKKDEFIETITSVEQTTHYFDQHPVPHNLEGKLPFTGTISINPNISSCENIFYSLNSQVDILIPAMASINDGFKGTKAIGEANKKYASETFHKTKGYEDVNFVEANSIILKFGLAYAMKDNKFKRNLVYSLKEGEMPIYNSQLFFYHKKGKQRFDEIKKIVDTESNSYSDIVFAEFPNFKGGYANMTAAYMTKKFNKEIGVCILQLDNDFRKEQRLNLITNNPNIKLNEVLEPLAIEFRGSSGGSNSSCGASIPKYNVGPFLEKLNYEVSKFL